MASIPIVSELASAMASLPAALKELPTNQAKARAEILDAVTQLAEAVSQALNVVSTRCGKMILERDDLNMLKQGLVNAPMLLNDFRLHGVCSALGKVRAELHTVLSMKRLSLGLFQRKKLERLLAEIQHKERDLEEDFDYVFRDLSRRASTLKRTDVPELITYLRNCQMEFEADVRTIREGMRQLENVM